MASQPDSFLDIATKEIKRCTTIEQLHYALRTLLSEIGVEQFLFFMNRGMPGHPTWPILIQNYAVEWSQRYLEAGYVSTGPLFASATTHSLPIDWNEYRGKAARTYRDDALAHGVGKQNLAFPICTRGGEKAFLNISSNMDDAAWRKFKQRYQGDLFLLAYRVHQQVVDCVADSGEAAPKLSPRELACLKLCAQGLRDSQSAEVLKISEPVVRGYLDHARTKLGASTRPHAVAIAVKLGLLDPHLFFSGNGLDEWMNQLKARR